MTDLKNKTVIITGASRGIGAATAKEFAANGASVMLSARSEAAIKALSDEINSSGGRAGYFAADVSDYAAMENLVEACKTQFAIPDILISNAGMLEPIERISESAPDAWARLIDVNVNGVYYLTRAAIGDMKSNGGGTVISIGSGAATSALEGWSHYCASKAAVHHFNACLHEEEAANNIRALVLSPGTVATDMQVTIRDSGVNGVSQIPWEAHIPADWPAKTMVWMCGKDADRYCGGVIQLRDNAIRKQVGLI